MNILNTDYIFTSSSMSYVDYLGYQLRTYCIILSVVKRHFLDEYDNKLKINLVFKKSIINNIDRFHNNKIKWNEKNMLLHFVFYFYNVQSCEFIPKNFLSLKPMQIP